MKIAAVLFASAIALTTYSLHASSNDLPPGWALGGEAPQLYAVAVDRADTPSGQGSVVLRRSETSHPYGAATLVQTLPIAQYAGKRIRMSANFKTEASEAGISVNAGMNSHMSSIDQHKGEWIWRVSEWTIGRDIKEFKAGVWIKGPGYIKIDEIKVEVLGDAPPGHKGTSMERQLTPAEGS